MVDLRVALCGQDCLRSGEGGAGGGEQSRPVETADRSREGFSCVAGHFALILI